MRKLAEGAYFAVLTLWVGGQWVVGYLVAPILFHQLESRQLAGELAGKMFYGMGSLGLLISAYILLFLTIRWRGRVIKRGIFWLVVLLAVLTAISIFGTQPLMAQLKADALPREVMESVLRDRFATWHGISSILYLVQSMLGLWIVVWCNRGLR